MNKKLKKFLDETDKTNAKIAELQEYLKSIQVAQKQEENEEIIRSIRSMKLGPKELFGLLNGLQEGTLSIQDVQAQMENAIAVPVNKEKHYENLQKQKELEESEDEE